MILGLKGLSGLSENTSKQVFSLENVVLFLNRNCYKFILKKPTELMLSLESVFLKHDNRIRDVNLYLDGFCLRPSQLDLMLDRTFERSFGLSVGFSLVRYSVLGSAQINSVRKAGLTIYGSVLSELSASDVRPY